MLPCNMTRFLSSIPIHSAFTRVRNSFRSKGFQTLKNRHFPIFNKPKPLIHSLQKHRGYTPTCPESLTPQTAADSINLHPSQTLFPDSRPCAPCSATMNLAYFDCFSGISGDMTLGALLDAGVDPGALRGAVARLGLPAELAFDTVRRGGFRATHARVIAPPEHAHRH